ncbi:MAG: hypothetical protein HY456_01775 [Parcubacteria group bacterium]|nr:hypothetical protein [Parcubacteria group bacterium]
MPLPSPPLPPLTRITDILRILSMLTNWVFALLMAISTIFIFFAAFSYLTAFGDPEKIKTANRRLIFAVVAIIVGLVALGVRPIIEQLLVGY